MSASIILDDPLRSKIERIVTEGGFTSADELVRKLVDEHIAVRELRSAVAIGIASPKHPCDPAFSTSWTPSCDGRPGWIEPWLGFRTGQR